MWDRDYWQHYRKTVWNADYIRWRRRRRWVRLGLAVLTLVLLSPVLLLYEWFHIHSNWGFAFLVFCVLVLLGIYRMLGWIGQTYRPPVDENSPPDDGTLPAFILDSED
jgi:hypothetical protein